MKGAPIAALAVDVDGTLLDPQHRISAAVGEAIADVHRVGVAVILASARFPGAIRPIQEALEIAGDLVVACQGAVVGRFTGGTFERVLEVPISPAATLAVLDAAGDAGLPVSHFAADAWHVAQGDPMAGQEADIVGCEPAIVPDLRVVAAMPSKLTVMAPPGREADLLALAGRLPASVRGSISRPDYLEIVDGAVSKATGLAAAVADLGLTVQQLAAAGDGANDLEMLELASLGIAMGHAPAAVRHAATWVVPSNADDGLAVAIRRLIDDGWVANRG